MKNENKARKVNRDSRAFILLDKYRNILQNNDYMISSLEVMKKIPEPTVSQRARIKELEEHLIPEGIREEQDLGGLLRPIVAELQNESTASAMSRKAVIELRYFGLLEWSQVAEVLHPDEYIDANRKRQRGLIAQAIRYHAKAIEQLDELIRDRGL